MSKYKILNSAGITAAIGLASLPAFLTLAPIFKPAAANAEPKTLGAAATVVPNLSLSADNLSITMTPTGSGSIFKTGSIDATVSTNNETGYTLYFSDKDFDNSLKHKNLSGHAIASTASAATGSDMLPNTWGYTLSDSVVAESESESNNATNLALSYEPIPTDYAAIKTTDSQTSGDISKLTFGVKIDNSIPSGVYSDEVLISAVINYSNTGYDQSKLWLDENGVQITTMQQMNYKICSSVPTPTVTATGSNVPEITLTDTRNNKSYKVRKLADGNCWMAESLEIADKTLTPADSNVAEDFELPAATASTGTSDSYDEAKVANDGGNSTYLYNWFAATAGSGTQSVVAGQSASQDICPNGWQLPNGSGDMSWNKLLRDGQGVYEIATSSNGYSATKVNWGKFTGGVETAANNPLGLQVTGLFYGGQQHLATTYGLYWTRTAASNMDAYRLLFDSGGSVNPQSNDHKRVGLGVRCVAKGTNGVTPATATYMQDVETCPASLPLEQKYTLKDKRDEKEYTVARLADGNCWMTQNLNLAGGSTLTASDSHVTTTRSIPVSDTTGFSDNNTAYVYNDNTNAGRGGYYSWKAATAGTAGTDKTSGDASEDVCPKSWRLPTKAEFNTLKSTTGWASAAAWTAAPFNGVLAGDYSGGSLYDAGSYGNYWSSTAVNANYAYRLYFNSSNVLTDGRYKRSGFSVRCVLE